MEQRRTIEATKQVSKGRTHSASFLALVLVIVVLLLQALTTQTASAAQESCDGTVIDGHCYTEVQPVGYADCWALYQEHDATACRAYMPFAAASENIPLAQAWTCPASPPDVVAVPVGTTWKGTPVVDYCEYPSVPNCAVSTVMIEARCWEDIGFDNSPGASETTTPTNPAPGQPLPAGSSQVPGVGHISLSYAVECVGDGIARVVMGSPTLSPGATISLITVNGSAAIGADIAGGDSVVVQVTPTRSSDQVSVVGPSHAPSCMVEVPSTASSAAAPAPAETSAPAAEAVPVEPTEAVDVPSEVEGEVEQLDVDPTVESPDETESADDTDAASQKAPRPVDEHVDRGPDSATKNVDAEAGLSDVAVQRSEVDTAVCEANAIEVGGECLALCEVATTQGAPNGLCVALQSTTETTATVAPIKPVEDAGAVDLTTLLAAVGAAGLCALAAYGAMALFKRTPSI